MSARSKARKRALDILYESDLRSEPIASLLAARIERADPPVAPYTVELVEGVTDHRERIDELVAELSEGWTLERMPPVDRNLLRLGAYELLWRDDVPDKVAVDEAVTLAHSLSTDESPGFVNGVLGRLLDLKPNLEPL